jgi:hypothetical protein
MESLHAFVLAAGTATAGPTSSSAVSTASSSTLRTFSVSDGSPFSGRKRQRVAVKLKAETFDPSNPADVKDEGADCDVDELGLSLVVKGEEEAEEKILVCSGCSRIKGSSFCFVNMDEIVQWPSGSSGRGLWCRDCQHLPGKTILVSFSYSADLLPTSRFPSRPSYCCLRALVHMLCSVRAHTCRHVVWKAPPPTEPPIHAAPPFLKLTIVKTDF